MVWQKPHSPWLLRWAAAVSFFAIHETSRNHGRILVSAVARALRQAREFVECGLNGPAAFKRRLLRFMAAICANESQGFLKARVCTAVQVLHFGKVLRGYQCG